MQFNRKLTLASALLASTAAVPAQAETAAETAARFGALDAVQQISMSPDGNKIAYISPVASGSVIFVADVAGGQPPKAIINAPAKDGRLNWCRWSTNTRLICSLSLIVNDAGVLLGFGRMIALDADGKNAQRISVETNSRSLGIMQDGGRVIDWDVADKPGVVLMTRSFVPESTMGTRLAASENGLGVEEVDTLTAKRSKVEGANSDAVGYISDGHGTVRIMATRGTMGDGYVKQNVRYLFRQPGSRKWELLSTVRPSDAGLTTGFDPAAVDSGKNVVYGFDDANGTQGLYSIALDGTGKRDLVLSRPDVDIDGLERIGRDNRVVGASYATEKRMTEFFDPELRKLRNALGKALPGGMSVDFIDASAGEAQLLMLASSDTKPGMFYRYTKATRQLEELLPVRPLLTNVALGTMQPITFTASDGTQVPGYLTLPAGSTGKGLPAIVMPHGGPGSRDEWGFDWLAQFYAARGFAVLQPNFRGSAGYGSSWYQKNGFQSWKVAIGDVNDAGRWLLSQGIAAPGKLGIVGWSYGGYAALQSSVLDPDLFKAIVAVAPVTDLERLRQDALNYTNYPLVNRFIGTGPHVREGSPAQNVDRIKAPVLMFHGDFDQNVAIGQARLMQDKLRGAGKQVEFVEFPGLDHYLLNSAARARLLGESDAFLRKHLGLPAN